MVLKDRYGFVKLAIENDLMLIPVVCFGEKWLYRSVLLPGPIVSFMHQLKMAGTVPFGRWYLTSSHIRLQIILQIELSIQSLFQK